MSKDRSKDTLKDMNKILFLGSDWENRNDECTKKSKKGLQNKLQMSARKFHKLKQYY